MKIGLVTGSDLDCVFLVLDETAPECDSASICRAAVLADVNHIQNERHRRIRGLRWGRCITMDKVGLIAPSCRDP